MDEIFTCVLLLLSFSGTLTKYVYVPNEMNWSDAQKNCRQTYTDLAPVSNMNDVIKLKQLSGNGNGCIWIGLQRSSPNRKIWMWSGGGAVSWFFWAQGEPDDHESEEDNACVHNSKCVDSEPYETRSSFCFSAIVVRETKTWEEALEYCRRYHDDLASVASETEMLLIQTELDQYSTSKHVWIALRFLAGDWLWVDGQEMNYMAWGPEGEPLCPNATMKCGALKVTGGSQGVWEAHDCEEKRHFICY